VELLLQQVKRFIPYGEGSRQCIGMGLAKVNVAGSLATLLSHFSFRLADEVILLDFIGWAHIAKSDGLLQ
jgi:cytochrome P450